MKEIPMARLIDLIETLEKFVNKEIDIRGLTQWLDDIVKTTPVSTIMSPEQTNLFRNFYHDLDLADDDLPEFPLSLIGRFKKWRAFSSGNFTFTAAEMREKAQLMLKFLEK